MCSGRSLKSPPESHEDDAGMTEPPKSLPEDQNAMPQCSESQSPLQGFLKMPFSWGASWRCSPPQEIE